MKSKLNLRARLFLAGLRFATRKLAYFMYICDYHKHKLAAKEFGELKDCKKCQEILQKDFENTVYKIKESMDNFLFMSQVACADETEESRTKLKDYINAYKDELIDIALDCYTVYAEKAKFE